MKRKRVIPKETPEQTKSRRDTTWTARFKILNGDLEGAAQTLIDKSYTYLSHDDKYVRDFALFVNSLGEDKILELLKKQNGVR